MQGDYSCRQRGLERLQTVLELAPECVAVLHVVVEFEKDYQHAVLALRVGLLLVHLLVSEDEVLQRFRHTLFHLCRCGSGIDSHACSLAHRELRHLLLRHDGESGHAQYYEHAYEEHHDVVVAHGRLDERTLYDTVGLSCYAPLYMIAEGWILLACFHFVYPPFALPFNALAGAYLHAFRHFLLSADNHLVASVESGKDYNVVVVEATCLNVLLVGFALDHSPHKV